MRSVSYRIMDKDPEPGDLVVARGQDVLGHYVSRVVERTERGQVLCEAAVGGISLRHLSWCDDLEVVEVVDAEGDVLDAVEDLLK